MEHKPEQIQNIHQGDLFKDQKPLSIEEFVQSKYFSNEEKIAYLSNVLSLSPLAIEIRDGVAYHAGTEEPIREYAEIMKNLYTENDNREQFKSRK